MVCYNTIHGPVLVERAQPLLREDAAAGVEHASFIVCISYICYEAYVFIKKKTIVVCCLSCVEHACPARLSSGAICYRNISVEKSAALSRHSWAILYYIILYYTILYYTILYYTILYYTILYYTILYYTILYETIRD